MDAVEAYASPVQGIRFHGSIPLASRFCPAKAEAINAEIDNHHTDGSPGEQYGRNVGVDELVQIVQQKAALICGHPGSNLKPLFHHGERARARQDLDQ